jgi:hypothetical protein
LLSDAGISGRTIDFETVSKYTSPLLGSLALESLMLSVDPASEKLIPWHFVRDYLRFLPEKQPA